MADLIGEQLGNYRLIRLLGRGGFGEVYLGQHLRLNMQAAIKVQRLHLTDEEIKTFYEEAQTVALLVHPHIVRVLDFDVKGDMPFLVMDYAPNGSLREHHPRGTPLALPLVVSYVKQMAAALQYAHDHHLIHRDVKPDNMLLGRGHEVVLTDFGLATIAHHTSSQSMEVMAGTVPYMAPEQVQGKPRPASDQYSLGIVAYEWLSGKRPFEGTATEIAMQHVLTPPPPLAEKVPTISPEVEQVVLIALAKDPKQRFRTIQAFATALEQAAHAPPFHPVVVPTQRVLPDEPAGATDEGRGIEPGQMPAPPKVAPPDQAAVQPETTTPLRSSLIEPTVPVGSLTQAVEPAVETPPSSPPLTSTGQQGKKPSRHLPARITLLLFVLGALLVAGSGFFYFATIRQSNLQHVQATATSVAQAKVSTTAVVGDPYIGHLYSDKLVLADPLRDNSKGYGWDQDDNCSFAGGVYHVKASGGNTSCLANTTDFTDFAFEVQMQLIQGDAGGIVFRFDKTAGQFGKVYGFYITHDGYYVLDTLNGSGSSRLAYNTNAVIKQGLNQTNVIAVVAQGSTITLYVNHQQIVSLTDSTSSHGVIGLDATPFGLPGGTHPTEAVFSNAKVWTFNGRLVLSDSLRDNSNGHKWAEDPINCGFAGGAYHVKAPNPNYLDHCEANATDYSNFVYEVQMQVIKGDGSGGLVFRYGGPQGFYFCPISSDGSYDMAIWPNWISQASDLKQGSSPAINKGLHQTNLIAVVVQGSTITLYVNHQQIASVINSTLNHGHIGLVTVPGNQPTEVVFSNAKVWIL